VAIAPLLWRFEHYGIEVTKGLAPVMKYAERLFSREAFIDSLTANEKAMRK
ncbi:MAG: glutathione S-transferase, partial [Deefgea sp.]